MKISDMAEPTGVHRKCYCFARWSLPNYTVFVLEISMPNVNLSRMTVEALMDLRKRVEETLHKRRAELQQQLARMETIAVIRRVVRGGGSALKGKKVPPKYRSPSGETWAGRGARPLWLVAAIKGGKRLDDFLIDKARKKRKKTA
jgi:DNA-binding protein H-NS